MPAILIQPDNRLLGWSANDLSLHGGQVLPGMSIGRAADAKLKPENAPATEDVGTAAQGEAAPPAITGDAGAAPATPSSAPVSSASSFETPHVVASQIAAGEGYITASSDAVTGSPLFFTSHGNPGGHLTTTDPAAQSAQPASLTAPAEGPAAITAPSLAAPLTETLDHLPLTQALDVAPVIDAVAAGLGELPLAAPLQTAADTVDAVVAPLSSVNPVAPVADILHGVGGTDPAAGIDTIVDLMKTADVFELRSATTDLIDHGFAPIMDTLATDAADGSALLGDAADITHHNGDGLLGALDTHHGLPGLG